MAIFEWKMCGNMLEMIAIVWKYVEKYLIENL